MSHEVNHFFSFTSYFCLFRIILAGQTVYYGEARFPVEVGTAYLDERHRIRVSEDEEDWDHDSDDERDPRNPLNEYADDDEDENNPDNDEPVYEPEEDIQPEQVSESDDENSQPKRRRLNPPFETIAVR